MGVPRRKSHQDADRTIKSSGQKSSSYFLTPVRGAFIPDMMRSEMTQDECGSECSHFVENDHGQRIYEELSELDKVVFRILAEFKLFHSLRDSLEKQQFTCSSKNCQLTQDCSLSDCEISLLFRQYTIRTAEGAQSTHCGRVQQNKFFT